MTEKMRQIISFYLILSVLMGIMSYSVMLFPYLPHDQRSEYLALIHSALLLFIPIAFFITMYRAAK